jgi:hypothetical protein
MAHGCSQQFFYVFEQKKFIMNLLVTGTIDQ